MFDSMDKDIIKVGGVQWTIYPRGNLFQGYVSIGGQKFLRQRPERKALIDLLKAETPTILRNSVALTPEDGMMWREATEILEPFNVSISDAARFYADKHRSIVASATCAEAVERFLAAKRSDSKTLHYIRILKVYLDKFSGKFGPRQIDSINSSEMNAWLRTLKMTGRTRNNIRGGLLALFHWCRDDASLLPKNDKTEADSLSRAAEEINDDPVIFDPDTFHFLIKMFEDLGQIDCVHYLAIGGMAGLRSAEIMRLHEEQFHPEQIEVKARQAKKTRNPSRRLIPICPALKSILKKYPPKFPVITPETQPRAALFAGDWAKNVLRHSYISYRLALVENVDQVTLESATSRQKVFSNYRAIKTADGRIVTKEMAIAWFADPFKKEQRKLG